MCVRLHIHPNLHTYSLRVCVGVGGGGGGGEGSCRRACRRVCECEGVVFQCVSVSLCMTVSKSLCRNVLFYAVDFCVFMHSIN